MLIRNESIKERSEITNLTTLHDNAVAYCTKYHGFKIIDAENHKLLTRVIHKDLGAYTTAVCFSPDSKLLAFANANVINVLSVETKKIIKSIKTASQKIEILTFCSNYVIAGTDEGRVFQYRYDNSAVLSRVCSFPYKKGGQDNYVSAFAVLGNNLAFSGQGGAIYVIDIYTQANKKVLLQQGKRVDALCFIDENVLVSADIDGVILVHDLNDDGVSKKINAPFVNVKQIVKMPNPDFIAISGEENYITLADIKKNKIVQTKYVEFQNAIRKITLAHERSLLVVLDDASVINVELSTPLDLKTHVFNNELDKAYSLVENEPMLLECNAYKMLEKQYDVIYRKTIKALMNQNKSLALKETAILKNVASKKQDLSLLFIAFEHYNRFKTLYLEKKYALAFAMSDKYPSFKYTPIHSKLEEAWNDSFVNAWRHMLLGKEENAKTLLNEYITVISKRPIIKLFLNKDSEFICFLQAIETKDFQTVEELRLKNKIFQDVPIYHPINQSIEKNLKNIENLIHKGELEKAKESLAKFKNTTHINKDLKKIYKHIENMRSLMSAYEKNDFRSCYEILDAHPALNKSELGVLLSRHWIKLVVECEDYALKANPKGIKTTLGDLILIETRRHRIGDLLRVSFHSKIKAYLAKNNFHGSQSMIYSYVDIFGDDKEINSLMRTHELMSKRKLAITHNQEARTPRDKWVDVEAIVS